MKLSDLLVHNWVRLPVFLPCAIALSLNFTLPAFADTKQLNLTVNTKDNQSFQSLLQEAENLVINSIQQSFQSSSNITDITVTVIGEHYGQQVPIMFISVSQAEWQKNPKITSGIKYFSAAEILLGFARSSQPVARSTTPSVTPKPSPYLEENEPNFYQ